jgi:hypothetical protein
MAEWSMAVVLKTCRIGYPKAVTFGGRRSPESIDSGQTRAI